LQLQLFECEQVTNLDTENHAGTTYK
jgi:hypothetical protein